MIQRDDEWIQAERYRTEDGFVREVNTSAGGQAVQAGTNGNRVTAGQTADGELYAGANGNVFRRTEDGQWETHTDGEWTSVNTEGARNSARSEADARGLDTSTFDTSSFDRGSFEANDPAASFERARSQNANIQRLERDRSARTSGRSRYESFNRDRSRSRRSGGRRR